MTFDSDLDAAMTRLAAWRLREARAMAQEILADLRGVDFSVKTLAILIGTADERLVPGVVATRCLVAAWTRWDKAGRRQSRSRAPLRRQGTSPRAF